MRCIVALLSTIIFWLTATGQSSGRANADSLISYIVTCSFRLASDSKVIIDSLAPRVNAADNEKLTEYYDAYKAGWQLYFSSLPANEKQKAKASIEQVAKTSPYPDLRAHMLFWIGTKNLFTAGADETKALTQVLNGKKLLEESHFEQFPYAIEYYKSMADVYRHFGDYTTCIYYTEKAAAEPPSKYWGRQTFYNDLGTYYTRLGNYEKAGAAYRKSIVAAKQLNQPSFALLVEANLGNLLRLQGRYKEALPVLYDHAIRNRHTIPEDAALARLYIANCLLHLDSVDKAKEFLVRPNFVIPHWTQPAYDLNWYQTQALYQQKRGALAAALDYKDSLMKLKDSIRLARDNKKIAVLESSIQAERFAAERAALERDRRWRNIIIVMLATASALVLVLLVLRHRAERRHETQKRLRAEEALAHANERLNQYLASIREKNVLIDQIRLQLQEATTVDKQLTRDDKAQYIENLQKSELFTEQDWERFKSIFEQVFPGYFSRLLLQYPDLTPAEIRLLALEQLDLSDREKGAMLNISADSIKKSRYRLRKKYPGLLSGIS